MVLFIISRCVMPSHKISVQDKGEQMKAILIIALLGLAIPSTGLADFVDTTAVRADTVKTAVTTTPAAANVPVNLGRHHIALGVLGYFKASSDDFTIPSLGIDASDGQSIFMNYRYSFDRNLDVVADVRGWVSEEDVYSTTITTTVVGFGAGVRYTAGELGGVVFPYVQASALSVGETVSGNSGAYTVTAQSEQGFGFAITGGAEIRLGRRIAIPVEAMYLFGKPGDDVSGFGITTGVSFNWGKVE
jgi:hypothetical protein